MIKKWFPLEKAGDLSRLSLLFQWKQWTLAAADLAALRRLSKDAQKNLLPVMRFPNKMQENLKGITMHTSVIKVEKCVYRKYSVQLFPGDPEFT